MAVYTEGIRKVLTSNKIGVTIDKLKEIANTLGYNIIADYNGTIHSRVNSSSTWVETDFTINDFKVQHQ